MAQEKSFPPIIDAKLPAFSGNTITIPFEMNRAENINDIVGMSAIIKTAITGKTIATLTSGKPYMDLQADLKNDIKYSNQKGKYVASFYCSEDLKIGQFYKVQIAYIKQKEINGQKQNIIGYYSSTGVIKKTAEPELKIIGSENTLFSTYNYTGYYSQKEDYLEKVYKYRFDLYDINDNLIDSSGECLHNTSQDEKSDESIDTWNTNAELVLNKTYILKYSILTTNGLLKTCSSKIVVAESVDIDLDMSIESKLNYEDGIIEIYLKPVDNNETYITGNFVLVRSSSLTNFTTWDEVYSFSYFDFQITKDSPLLLWEDFSVEQGEEYKYAIQAYNSYNLYSNKLETINGKILVDFEHCYISDSERQLRIQFNPKISSLKNNILETKVNTLGGKYPFIFKNGYVHYKEFPISGLLSLTSDPNNKFIIDEKKSNITNNSFNSKINLTSENIYNERQFRMKVLEWLNNGEPKVFRSPTEGNFIVRIMNVSLAPNDTLGRMLYTLSCTAYEIDDWKFSNLLKYNLTKPLQEKLSSVRIGQICPSEMIASTEPEKEYPLFILQDNNTITFPPSYSVNITEATPGTCFQLKFLNGDSPTVEIGGTGAYYVQIAQKPSKKENNYFTEIKLISGKWDEAKITFEYYVDAPSDAFSKISNIIYKDEIRRLTGPGYNINLVDPYQQGANLENIISDIRREIGIFYFIKAEKRYIQEMWKIENKKYARNSALTDIINDNEWNPLVIYHDNVDNIYYDGQLNKPFAGQPDFRFCLNGIETNYSDFGGRKVEDNATVAYGNTFGRIDAIRNVEDIKTLRAGNGILLDVSYRVKIKEYVIENNERTSLAQAKQEWNKAELNLFNLLKGEVRDVEPSPDNIKIYSTAVDIKYKNYIRELTEALND